jgi:tetratricopeptide (TPR) repeat protein
MSAVPSSSPAGGVRRRRLLPWLMALLAGAGLIAAGVAVVVSRSAGRPTSPPVIELSGLDAKAAQSITSARAAVESQPRAADAWGRLGMVLLANDLQTEALTCFAEAERLDPADARWPYYQGFILVPPQPEAAVAPLRRALALGGTEAGEITMRLRLAEALLVLDRPDEAEPLFRDVLEAQPDNPRGHLGLGQVAHRRGELRLSLDHLRIAAGSPFSQRAAHAVLADVYQRQGDAPAAENERRQVADLPPDAPWPDAFADAVRGLQTGRAARLDRANQLMNAGQMGEAIDLIRAVIHDHPDSYQAHGALADAYLRMDKLPQAESELRKVVKLNPESLAGHLLLGEVLAKKKDDPGAEASYRRVIELKPSHPRAHYSLGQCRLRQHDPAGAAAEFRLALRYQPNFVDGHVALAEVLLQEGQSAEARSHLEDVLRLAPGHEKASSLLQQIE